MIYNIINEDKRKRQEAARQARMTNEERKREARLRQARESRKAAKSAMWEKERAAWKQKENDGEIALQKAAHLIALHMPNHIEELVNFLTIADIYRNLVKALVAVRTEHVQEDGRP